MNWSYFEVEWTKEGNASHLKQISKEEKIKMYNNKREENPNGRK